VRFAPSPTGSLHVGNALSAVANRRFGDWLLLRIDDTDPARNLPGGEDGVLEDLQWLGVDWDEGPVRQSSRASRHMEVAREAGLPQRFEGVMLWRDDESPTFHLASVVDDADFGITHVIRGSDHRPNEELAARLDIPVEAVAVVRGAHDLTEGASLARGVLDPPPAAPPRSPETNVRFVELRTQLPEYLGKEDAKALQRELKAVGGDLRALRVSLTGAERGPELW